MDRVSRQPWNVTLAQSELGRVSQLTKQTLGFYRDNSRPEAVDIGQLLDEVLAFYDARLRSRDIQVERRYGRGEGVHAVAGELRQVFFNLVANSFDAMPDGGKLTVRIAYRGRNGRRGVRVTVADTGVGIALENLRNVFEPFFTTKKDVGTGLGLWVAQEIVNKHGGALRVRSRTGDGRSGTVFTVFLPETIAQDPKGA